MQGKRGYGQAKAPRRPGASCAYQGAKGALSWRPRPQGQKAKSEAKMLLSHRLGMA